MKKYWIGFAAVILISFAVLGWVGTRIYHQAPPIADKVIATDGTALISSGEIAAGQNVWQALGGMEVGSIWGHGSYVAPDWSADWLHLELVFILNDWSQKDFQKSFDALTSEQQSSLTARLTTMIRKNTYDANTNTITVDPVRARAFQSNLEHYTEVFSNGKAEYAIPKNTQSDPVKLRQLAAFIFWSSWAASTNRPDDNITYTSNWPHEDLIQNKPTGEAVVWTGVSIIVLLAGIGGMALFYASRKEEGLLGDVPASDPLLNSSSTPSQLATLKYFWTVLGLMLLQMGVGMVTAHYGVEGDSFYGIPLAKFLPYSIARTWHTQLGIFWIATAWLAAGLFIGPAVSGVEPKFQLLGVNVLFGALLVVVLGSMAGEWMSIMHVLPDNLLFYFGHSGFEYIDLGKFFQIALLVGLILWFVLMYRAIRPALQRKDEQKPILTLFLISSGAIASFYGAALMVGKHTNLAVAEYWRWWVVHLWVEGFFEVFATVVVAFLFARLKLVSLKTAGQATVLSATIFLSGGIIGTLHHLYFSGTPTIVLALGSVFSALEVVPLVFVGYEAWENIKLSGATVWIKNYKWPIYYFVSVAFWNLVGAGLFGFMINPPIALYYMQGLNTTPVHAHAALFGVYGMLGIGLLLFSLRAMNPRIEWNEKAMKFSFWTINIGLMMMVTLSLLPVGLMQTWASVEHGYWYARSAEFLQTGVMSTLRWMRVPGDSIFAIGIAVLVFFVFGLTMKKSFKEK
ncbi:MAG: nitric-oxide reductase large subunit [Bacteroidota bacterium]|nr:nitric-oxide reductase large subunit [Bacteroidota bacterium]